MGSSPLTRGILHCRETVRGHGRFTPAHAGNTALAAKLASKSSTAHAGQKRLIRKYFYGGMENFAKDEGIEMAAASRQPDFTEAVNAFIEKRMPAYNLPHK